MINCKVIIPLLNEVFHIFAFYYAFFCNFVFCSWKITFWSQEMEEQQYRLEVRNQAAKGIKYYRNQFKSRK